MDYNLDSRPLAAATTKWFSFRASIPNLDDYNEKGVKNKMEEFRVE
jgi:hypothetical protein